MLNIALDTTSSLEKVSIARCVTKPDLVVPLLNSLVGNKALKNKEVSLDMSKNKVEEREIQPMCQVFLFLFFFFSFSFFFSSLFSQKHFSPPSVLSRPSPWVQKLSLPST